MCSWSLFDPDKQTRRAITCPEWNNQCQRPHHHCETGAKACHVSYESENACVFIYIYILMIPYTYVTFSWSSPRYTSTWHPAVQLGHRMSERRCQSSRFCNSISPEHRTGRIFQVQLLHVLFTCFSFKQKLGPLGIREQLIFVLFFVSQSFRLRIFFLKWLRNY